jgi:hypothetical protein
MCFFDGWFVCRVKVEWLLLQSALVFSESRIREGSGQRIKKMSVTRLEVQANEFHLPPEQRSDYKDPTDSTKNKEPSDGAEQKTIQTGSGALIKQKRYSQRKSKTKPLTPSTFTCLDGGEWWIRTKEEAKIIYSGLAHDIMFFEGRISPSHRMPNFAKPSLTKEDPMFPLYLLRCKRIMGKHFDFTASANGIRRYSLESHLAPLQSMLPIDTGECMLVIDEDFGLCDYNEEEIRQDVTIYQTIMIEYGCPKEWTEAIVLATDDDGVLGIHIAFPYTRYFIEECYWIRFIAVHRFNKTRERRGVSLLSWDKVIDRKIYTGGLRVPGVQKAKDCKCLEDHENAIRQRKSQNKKKKSSGVNTVSNFMKNKTAAEESEQQIEMGRTMFADSTPHADNSLDPYCNFLSEKDKSEVKDIYKFAESRCKKCAGSGHSFCGRRYFPRFAVDSDGKKNNNSIKFLFPDPEYNMVRQQLYEKQAQMSKLTVNNPMYYTLRNEISELNAKFVKLYPGLVIPDRTISKLALASSQYPNWRTDLERLTFLLMLLDIRCTFLSQKKFPHTPFIVSPNTARPNAQRHVVNPNNGAWPETWIQFCESVIAMDTQSTLNANLTLNTKKADLKNETFARPAKSKLSNNNNENETEEQQKERKERNHNRYLQQQHKKMFELIEQGLFNDFKRDPDISTGELLHYKKLKEFKRRSHDIPESVMSQQIHALENFINTIIPNHNPITSDHDRGARRVPQWKTMEVRNLIFSSEYTSIIVIVRGDGSRYCTWKKDYHESNHIYFILRSCGKDFLKLYQYCHNDDCTEKCKNSVRCWKIENYRMVSLFAPKTLTKTKAAAKEAELYFQKDPKAREVYEQLLQTSMASERKAIVPTEEKKMKKKLQKQIYRHRHSRLGSEFVINDSSDDDRATNFVEVKGSVDTFRSLASSSDEDDENLSNSTTTTSSPYNQQQNNHPNLITMNITPKHSTISKVPFTSRPSTLYEVVRLKRSQMFWFDLLNAIDLRTTPDDHLVLPSKKTRLDLSSYSQDHLDRFREGLLFHGKPYLTVQDTVFSFSLPEHVDPTDVDATSLLNRNSSNGTGLFMNILSDVCLEDYCIPSPILPVLPLNKSSS